MALPSELCAVEATWALESGAEICVNRFWLQHVHQTGNSFSWPDDLHTVASKVATSLLSKQGPGGYSVRQLVTSQASLTKVDAYAVGTDGKATAKATSTPDAGTNNGGMGGTELPPQMAPIVQLWAYNGFVQHARRHRGRVYAPPPASSALATNGRLSSDFMANIVDAWSAFFNDVQGMHVGSDASGVALGGSSDIMRTGVLSRVDNAFYQLESVSVAQDLGVQRRRTNKLSRAIPARTTISHN